MNAHRIVEFLFHAYGWVNQARPIKRSRWPHFDLFFLHSGALRMRIGRRTVTLRGPQGVLIFPHTQFEAQAVDGVCRASVQHFRIRTARPATLPLPFRRLVPRTHGFELFDLQRCQQHEADVHRAIAMAEVQPRTHLHDIRTALLCLLLGELSFQTLSRSTAQAGKPLPAPFVELEAWLWQDLGRPRTVRDMAGQLGMSFGAFRANFRSVVGISPARFLRDARMREAQRLLRETEHSTKQIGRLVGYPELPHLYRTFRAHFGMTPAAYRATVRHFS